MTGIVQSSSAVTVATIGFVNAGIVTLYQALGVIYGANVGTTMTGWLVSLVGFNIKIEALALPIVGVGAALRLLARNERSGSFGLALAGFRLFSSASMFCAMHFRKPPPISISQIGRQAA